MIQEIYFGSFPAYSKLLLANKRKIRRDFIGLREVNVDTEKQKSSADNTALLF